MKQYTHLDARADQSIHSDSEIKRPMSCSESRWVSVLRNSDIVEVDPVYDRVDGFQ